MVPGCLAAKVIPSSNTRLWTLLLHSKHPTSRLFQQPLIPPAQQLNQFAALLLHKVTLDGGGLSYVPTMPQKDFIDVRILVDGQPLREYPDPDHNTDAEYKFSRYIEVKAGQKFAVQVTWLQGFRLKFAPFLYYELYFDDDDEYFIFNPFPGKLQNHRKGVLTKEVKDLIPFYGAKGKHGSWEQHPLVFGALGISESPCAKVDKDRTDFI